MFTFAFAFVVSNLLHSTSSRRVVESVSVLQRRGANRNRRCVAPPKYLFVAEPKKSKNYSPNVIATPSCVTVWFGEFLNRGVSSIQTLQAVIVSL